MCAVCSMIDTRNVLKFQKGAKKEGVAQLGPLWRYLFYDGWIVTLVIVLGREKG